MFKRETIYIIIIIMLYGLIIGLSVNSELTAVLSLPLLTIIGVFFTINFKHLKHSDDLNLTRKKDVSLEFITHMSEVRFVLADMANQKSLDDFLSDFTTTSKDMNASLDKFHTICSDTVSKEVELYNSELIEIMLTITKKYIEIVDDVKKDKLKLLKWLIDNDIYSRLNLIRYEIIKLVNSEIGDNSGKICFKEAIEENNEKFKNKLSKMLE